MSVIRGYGKAVSEEDGEAACNLLTGAAQQKLLAETREAGSGATGGGCPSAAVASGAAFGGDSVANVRVENIKVQGDSATALGRFPDVGSTEYYLLARIGGKWKIEDYGDSARPEQTQSDETGAEEGSEAPPGVSGERSCGEVQAADPASDQPVDITAENMDCETAKRVAEAVTVDGSDPPSGFQCPRAETYGAESQTCTNGRQEVRWNVQVR